MNTNSIWFDDAPHAPSFTSLNSNIQTEVAIIGAGMHGLLAAYLLAKAGKKVVVFEKNTIASGTTAYTTAFISNYTDLGFAELVKTAGNDAKTVWHACQSAVDLIEKIVQDEHIECEFRRLPLHVYATDTDGEKYLQKEQECAGKIDVTTALLPAENFSFTNFGALKINGLATFHPLKFLYALTEKISQMDVQIFEHTHVTKIETSSPALLQAGNFQVTAENVIAATHTPVNSQLLFPILLSGHTTYVIAGTAKADSLPQGLCIDTQTPYHYLRVDSVNGKDRFVFGGEDVATGKTHEDGNAFEKLESELRERFRTDITVTHQWGGEVFDSLDGLPYIGRHPLHSNQFFGTGYSGDGLPYSTLSAMIETDLILGQPNPYEKLFSPKRLSGWEHLITHGMEVGAQVIKQKFSPKPDREELGADEGAVVQEQGKELAVYKDRHGKIHTFSAKCTHEGCTVNWNKELKSWDCPCHGSRFAATGEVLSGPATKPLQTE